MTTPRICPCCGQAIRAKRTPAAAVPVAQTAAEILKPVGRRKIGRDRVRVPVECLFADGATTRLTIARHPKDSDALAVEAGRRLAVLLRADAAYMAPHRAAAAAHYAAAHAEALAGMADAWRADHADREFTPSEYESTVAHARANDATRAWLESNPPPPLAWHGRRLSYPAAVIEQAARDLVECRIAPPESIFADAAE